MTIAPTIEMSVNLNSKSPNVRCLKKSRAEPLTRQPSLELDGKQIAHKKTYSICVANNQNSDSKVKLPIIRLVGALHPNTCLNS